MTRPLRLMTLHFSQIGFAEGFTFILGTSFKLRPEWLLRAPCDAALRQIVGAHLKCDFVSRQDADEVHAQLAGNVCQQAVPALDLHKEHRIGHGLYHDTFYFDDVFFGQASTPSLAV